MTGTRRCETAVRAAKVGGATILEYFRTGGLGEEKVDGSLVTKADRVAQERISSVVESEFPDEITVGEEGDAESAMPERGTAWVVDPIDGTGKFTRGGPLWCVSVAAGENGEPVAAVNQLPAVGDTYVASSRGINRNGEPVRIGDIVRSVGRQRCCLVTTRPGRTLRRH